MTVIARPTSAFGLLSSFVLLHHGMEKMAQRYPLSLALALAYGIFLLLIWLCPRTNADDYVDIADLPNALPSDGGGMPDVPLGSAGGGAEVGGGGPSAAFDSPIDAGATDVVQGVGKSLGFVAGLDKLAIPLWPWFWPIASP